MKYSKQNIVQFIKFGLVGASNTIVSTGVYWILTFFGIHYIIANAVGFVVGTLNAYILNDKFVFKKEEGEERSTAKTGAKVFISYGLSFLLSTILLMLWIDILEISEYIAPIINVCITTPLNFIMNKFWAFKNKKKESERNE